MNLPFKYNFTLEYDDFTQLSTWLYFLYHDESFIPEYSGFILRVLLLYLFECDANTHLSTMILSFEYDDFTH